MTSHEARSANGNQVIQSSVNLSTIVLKNMMENNVLVVISEKEKKKITKTIPNFVQFDPKVLNENHHDVK